MSPRKTPSLPQDEVQRIADLALVAWERGTPESITDSLLGVWDFLALRAPFAALSLARTTDAGTPKERRIDARVGGMELGASAHVRLLLASTVNAMVSPP